MSSRSTASLLAAAAVLALASPATASNLPPIKVSADNQVPACATPGRMMAMLKSRNGTMDPRYADIAVHYMRHGEDLGIRWDVAFFQMLVETANLKYTGDVDADQNNFAGIGATGNGVKGERFVDVSSGVRAHLEHVLMYTGERIENPVAERTRKVQEWGVLTSWQRQIKGPMTFTHLTTRWSPGDRGYSRDIQAIANIFNSRFCNAADPQPELVAAARGEARQAGATAAPGSSTADLVAAVIERSRPQASERSSLGAGSLVAGADAAAASAPPAAAAEVAVINAGSAKADAPAAKTQKVALAGGEAAKALKPAQPETGKCRVWTASYGGSKAIIIKAASEGVTNYTVLDVNPGKEKREAQAYIAAYAKGGETVAEFSSPSAALEQAFKLCPEG